MVLPVMNRNAFSATADQAVAFALSNTQPARLHHHL